MARVIPTAFPDVDPDRMGAGRRLYSGLNSSRVGWGDLAAAQNYLAGRTRSGVGVNQGWQINDGAFAGPARTPAPKPASPQGVWRIPDPGQYYADKVDVSIRAIHALAGAGGTVWFDSLNAGGAVAIPVPAAGAFAWFGDLLPVNYAGGYEEIELRVGGDGVFATQWQHASVKYREEPSPLPTPAAAETYVPWDDDEVDFDSPLTSDQGRQHRSNDAIPEGRPRLYLNWSALVGLDAVPAPLVGTTLGLQGHLYRIWTPLNSGPPINLRRLTYHVLIDAGVQIQIQAGRGDAWAAGGATSNPNRYEILGAGPGLTWETGVIDLFDSQELRSGAPPWPVTHLDVRVNAAPNSPVGLDYTYNEVVRSINLWGR